MTTSRAMLKFITCKTLRGVHNLIQTFVKIKLKIEFRGSIGLEKNLNNFMEDGKSGGEGS